MKIVSVFGQIDAVAADIMIEQGKLTKIEVKDFPEGAPLFDLEGRKARYAVIVPAQYAREFEELRRDLYA